MSRLLTGVVVTWQGGGGGLAQSL